MQCAWHIEPEGVQCNREGVHLFSKSGSAFCDRHWALANHKPRPTPRTAKATMSPAAVRWHCAMAEYRATILKAESVAAYYERMGITDDDLKRVAR